MFANSLEERIARCSGLFAFVDRPRMFRGSPEECHPVDIRKGDVRVE
jgi:hypothetical protein